MRLLHSHARYYAIAVARGSLKKLSLVGQDYAECSLGPAEISVGSALKRFSAGMRSSMWS
jgi:hypothetical protein